MAQKQIALIDPDRDTRALIYQQVEELEAYAKGLGTVVVQVEEIDAKDQSKHYAVTYVLSPEQLRLKVRAEGPDLNEAIIEAKHEAKRQLPAVLNALADQGITLNVPGMTGLHQIH